MVAGRYIAAELAPGLHRLELPATGLGLAAPPHYTELTLAPARQGWSLRALAGKGQSDDLGRWLTSVGATDLQSVTGREPGFKGKWARLPGPLAFAATAGTVEQVGLGSDGSAFLVLRAPRAAFAQLVRRVESLGPVENAVPELTHRQAELLQFCKDKGYYDIPRRRTLRDLARELGISPTALSLALRRAEARILSAYVERLRHTLPRKAPARRSRRTS